ncbi:hypothetical protein GCM10009838_43440 [Catenulispora subtropica]|uniref:Uncharacterized protein n=1 Tax=Catenulispora subtropica TaxID=450798 RepID=A0ABN2S0G9_9ACTN
MGFLALTWREPRRCDGCHGSGALRRRSSLTRARSVLSRVRSSVTVPGTAQSSVTAGRVDRSRTFSISPIAMKLANIEEPP